MRLARAVPAWLVLLGASLLTCGHAETAVAQPAPQIEARYVVMGPDGEARARVITAAGTCPALVVDGTAMVMELRAAAATEPQRPTKSSPQDSKPSAFPVRVCEAILPVDAHAASAEGLTLPIPRKQARRIVVIGDTGCRLKAADNAWQACNDPAAYPFARIAALAAAWKPDLVVHVGDYNYRENACPQDHPGCTGSPWGYGWDTWQADFFGPGQPLLAVAPLVAIRGNHENCARAGQGWWRFVDPRPLQAGHDCNDPANDAQADYSPAYAVPLGSRAQIVVMDLSAAGTSAFPADDPRTAQFEDSYRQLASFARGANFTFAADHYPVLGVAAKEQQGATGFDAGNRALQGVFARLNPHIIPPGVDALLAGHIHLWQQVDFGGKQPSQFIAGFSGTQEDVVPLPRKLPSDVSPAPDAAVRDFHAIVDAFGFMTLERTGSRSWRATVYSVTGEVMQRCRLRGRRSHCGAA
ncbi:MAG: metallophosphoesterase [Croceibacterium sp.]